MPTPFIVQALFVKIGEFVMILTSVCPEAHESAMVGSYVCVVVPSLIVIIRGMSWVGMVVVVLPRLCGSRPILVPE